MDFSKVNCPQCGDHFFIEKHWITACASDREAKTCLCKCLNCESHFSFRVQNDQLVSGSLAIESEEFMQELEKQIGIDNASKPSLSPEIAYGNY